MSGAQSPLPVFVRACVPAETPMRVYGCCYGLLPPRRGESFTYLRRQHSATARSDQGDTSQCPADLLAYPCLHRHPHQQQQEGTGSAGAVPSPPSPLPSGGPGCSTGGGRRTPRGPAPDQRTYLQCTTTLTDLLQSYLPFLLYRTCRRVRGSPEPPRLHPTPCARGAPGAPPVVADAPLALRLAAHPTRRISEGSLPDSERLRAPPELESAR